MSMKRQPDGERLFRITRSAKPRGAVVALHAHDEAQLVFADSGTMQIYAAAGRWLVPPRLAVWIPARVPHQVEVLADTQHWIMRWHRTALRDWAPPTLLDRAFALKVTPLLRALIAAAFAADATPAKVELIVKLVLHELNETPDAPTFLPLPASPIGRRVADLALADPQQPARSRRARLRRSHVGPDHQPPVPHRNRDDLQGLAATGRGSCWRSANSPRGPVSPRSRPRPGSPARRRSASPSARSPG